MPVVTEVDGRRLRRAQNRDAVLDALVSVFEDGVHQPTSAEVAERAGISPRSLFRYFDDADDLTRAAIERHLQRSGALFDLDVTSDASLHSKVAAIVEQRARLFDTIAPIARTARVTAHRNKIVAERLRQMRAHLRAELARVLGPVDALAAIDVLLSFESYELLRYDQKLSRAAAIDALTTTVEALLA